MNRTTHSMNGRPATGAIGLGRSGRTCRMRVPNPPARITAVILSSARSIHSHVRVTAIPQNGVAFDQFVDAAVQVPLRFKAGRGEPRIRDDIIPLVRILSNRRFEEDKLWK